MSDMSDIAWYPMIREVRMLSGSFISAMEIKNNSGNLVRVWKYQKVL